MILNRRIFACAVLSVAMFSPAIPTLFAQDGGPPLQPLPKSARPIAVKYLFPEQVSVAANKPTPVDLHFKIADGLHVNSHTPHTEEFIPTTLQVPETSGVRLSKAVFPPGTDFAFSADPSEKLSVYTGEFTIHAELVATKGNHLVEGTLNYQACDNQMCMPPHSIPVTIDVISK